MSQHEGIVRWFNDARGFGFLGRDGDSDVFVHYSAIQAKGYKGLKEGEMVSFDVVMGNKGRLQADQVVVIRKL